MRLQVNVGISCAAVIALAGLLTACQGTATTGTTTSVEQSTGEAALPTGSCEELERAFETEARALARACETKEDCSHEWSDYNCYAIRSKRDDVTKLEQVDEAMKKQGCSEVECEPPPPLECKAGRCEWAT